MDVLQFSGGKDSLACLYLLKEEWDNIVVLWTNAGAPWPQTVEFMEEIRELVPHFMEITGDVHQQNQTMGIPTDVVPVVNTLDGQVVHGKDPILLQSWFSCCGANLWAPMHNKMQELKPEKVYRGQRRSEKYTAPFHSGIVHQGIQYIFPIENWSEEEVDWFLKENHVKIPDYYQWSDKSLDCWHCTAYLDERERQIHWLRDNMPRHYRIVSENLRKIKVAVEKQTGLIDAALG
jgi:phosphoadenosine phosphosulfate reductase